MVFSSLGRHSDEPAALLDKGEFGATNVIIGVTQDEGSVFLTPISGDILYLFVCCACVCALYLCHDYDCDCDYDYDCDCDCDYDYDYD